MKLGKLLGGVAAASLIASGLVLSPAASGMTVDGKAAADDRCEAGSADAGDARVPYGVSGASDPNTLTQAQVDQMERRTARLLDKRGVSPTARPNGSVIVPTHVHVLVRDNGTGDVKNWQIRRQMDVLNESFAGRTAEVAANTPFRFRLDSVERTRNTDWYTMDEEDSREARRALRVGDARHLNLYITHFKGDLEELLGFATFPEQYRKAPRLDGAVIWRQSLPGGNAIYETEDGVVLNYARGDTATHEVGHWMNLYHTFQGNCGPKNDYVTDTPRQKFGENVFYCRPEQNTCAGPGSPRDPVKNFMNYVADTCMDHFTPGQKDRMNISWYIRQALSN